MDEWKPVQIMNVRLILAIGLIFFGILSGCGNSVTKGGKGKLNNSTAENSASNANSGNTGNSGNSGNVGNGGNSGNIDPALCGDGSLDPGEACDPSIAADQTGACPTTCSAPDSCSMASLVGSADGCTLECVIEPKACLNGDGCCPTGCDSSNDDDCTNLCGNGDIEAGELCDGNCPTSCQGTDACNPAQLVGSASTCNAQCQITTITACNDGDGCCPSGCEGQDSDCACIPDDPCAARECGTATNSCGDQVSCGTCNEGTCSAAGVCEIPTPTSTIGDGCSFDGDCDGTEICLDESSTVFDGGYCSHTCTSSSDCPAGSVCSDSGDCLKSCTTDADCPRSDYLCTGFDDVPGDVCFVAGVGTGAPGDACTSVTDCTGGTDGICFAGDPGGYCSEVCSSNADCPFGSHCGSNGACFDTCGTDIDCRSQYGCGDLDFDGQKECMVVANGPGQVGDSCSVQRDCSGGVYGFCATGTNYPNGSCTVFCGPGAGSCGSGSFCSNAFQQPLCLESCTSDTQCRSGYTCEDLGDGESGCIKL